MMFSQMAWEKAADQIWAYREEYRQRNQGEETPPIHIADFVACHADGKKAEEIAHRHIVGYYWSVMEHYEMAGTHFAETGKSYAHYAKAAEQMKAVGQDAVIEEFLSAQLWGDPDLLVAKLRKRRELIGDFEVNGVFSYQSLPFAQVESSMRLFAKEVGPEIKSWQRQDRRQPIAVAPAVSAAVAK
jgi:hypothetical protein